MKNLIRQASWRIYRYVHSNGLLADAVYSMAFYFFRITRRRAYRRAQQDMVSPEELWQHRELQGGGGLQTGVTNICNAKCTFCAYPKVVANKTLQTGVMSLTVFKKAVDEWAALGGRWLDLTPVVGDPLVDPGLLEKVDYAVNHAHIKNVLLTTNAILLNRNETYKKLIDLGVSGIFISTQGANKEAYEQVYGVKHYPEVISGLRNLLEYNQKKASQQKSSSASATLKNPVRLFGLPILSSTSSPFCPLKSVSISPWILITGAAPLCRQT